MKRNQSFTGSFDKVDIRIHAIESMSCNMVNTEIRLIIFFATKDGEALYSQQKQDRELNCGSDYCKPLGHSGMT